MFTLNPILQKSHGSSTPPSGTEHYTAEEYGSISSIASLRMAALEATEAYGMPIWLLWGAVGGFLIGCAVGTTVVFLPPPLVLVVLRELRMGDWLTEVVCYRRGGLCGGLGWWWWELPNRR